MSENNSGYIDFNSVEFRKIYYENILKRINEELDNVLERRKSILETLEKLKVENPEYFI